MKKIYIWVLALVITIIAFFQWMTGSDYPSAYSVRIGSDTYRGELLRAHTGERDCLIEVPVDDKGVSGNIFFKRYPGNVPFNSVRLVPYRNELCGILPLQPPGGKLQYYIELIKDGKPYYISKEEPVVIRFRGNVPAWIRFPHRLLILLALFFSTVSGLYILFKKDHYRKYVDWTFIALLAGGFLFGPFVQKYAYGEFWSRVPFGFDLADYKILPAFLFWTWAFVANRRKERRIPVLIAGIMTLLIFSIPQGLIDSVIMYSGIPG